MGKVIHQSTLVRPSFYREIPVDALVGPKEKTPTIASWGFKVTALVGLLLFWQIIQGRSTVKLLVNKIESATVIGL